MTEPSPKTKEATFFVYLLRCSDGSLYTGIAANVSARLSVHDKGKGAKYTRGRLPVSLVYQERLESKSLALKREIQVKKLSRRQKDALVQNQAR